VVWRDVFEGNMKCSLDDAIAAHAQAVFVDEGDAKEYCTFKNTTPPAQQAQQKPVAWADEIIDDLNALFDSEMIKEIDSGDALIRLDAAICAVEEAEERYTTPPAAQRQPLTDDRIGQIIEQCKITLVNYCSDEKQIEFARAIEVAHGIKETNT
jgi:hypothetical protein